MNQIAQIWIALCVVAFFGILTTQTMQSRFVGIEKRIEQLERKSNES